MESESLLRVFRSDREFHTFKIKDDLTILDIIQRILRKINIPLSMENLFAIKEVGVRSGKWLSTYERICNLGCTNCRYFLFMRFIPENLLDIKEPSVFSYLYEQLKQLYTTDLAAGRNFPESVAWILGCLMIKKSLNSITSKTLSKKLNLKMLEKDLDNLLPSNLLSAYKKPQLCKMIARYFQSVADYSEDDCCREFIRLLSGSFTQYFVEQYSCRLLASLSDEPNGLTADVLLRVGREGVEFVYETKTYDGMRVWKQYVDTGERWLIELTDLRAVAVQGATLRLQIMTNNLPQTNMLLFNNSIDANSVASGIDGYYQLKMSQSLITSWLDVKRSSNGTDELVTHSDSNNGTDSLRDSLILSDTADAAYVCSSRDDFSFAADNSRPAETYEIYRHELLIGDFIGQGQFGDVRRGVYRQPSGIEQHVAIKTCKLKSIDDADYEAIDPDEVAIIIAEFFEEAYMMQKFHHANIIGLVGISTDNPLALVMELAELGQLRIYLQEHSGEMSLPEQLTFALQIASAALYVGECGFVHRDIAARNVLVFEPALVKLADFGLARPLGPQRYYQSAREQKLPIKWMPPEAINFRLFTTASDVWMFGVCFWEIMAFGLKPWTEHTNQQMIDLLESNQRLAQPVGCPIGCYQLMQACWEYDPHRRVTMSAIVQKLSPLVGRRSVSFGDTPHCATERRNSFNRLSWQPACPDVHPSNSATPTSPETPAEQPAPVTRWKVIGNHRWLLVARPGDNDDPELRQRRLELQKQQAMVDQRWLRSVITTTPPSPLKAAIQAPPTSTLQAPPTSTLQAPPPTSIQAPRLPSIQAPPTTAAQAPRPPSIQAPSMATIQASPPPAIQAPRPPIQPPSPSSAQTIASTQLAPDSPPLGRLLLRDTPLCGQDAAHISTALSELYTIIESLISSALELSGVLGAASSALGEGAPGAAPGGARVACLVRDIDQLGQRVDTWQQAAAALLHNAGLLQLARLRAQVVASHLRGVRLSWQRVQTRSNHLLVDEQLDDLHQCLYALAVAARDYFAALKKLAPDLAV